MLQVPCFQLSGSQVTGNDCGDLGELEPTASPGTQAVHHVAVGDCCLPW